MTKKSSGEWKGLVTKVGCRPSGCTETRKPSEIIGITAMEQIELISAFGPEYKQHVTDYLKMKQESDDISVMDYVQALR